METRKDEEDQLVEWRLELNFHFIAFEREREVQRRETSALGIEVECMYGHHRVRERQLFAYVPCPAQCTVCVPCVVQKCGDGPYKCPLCKRLYSRLETQIVRLHGLGLKEPHLT